MPHLAGHVLSVTGYCWHLRPVPWLLGSSQGRSSISNLLTWGYPQVKDVGLRWGLSATVAAQRFPRVSSSLHAAAPEMGLSQKCSRPPSKQALTDEGFTVVCYEGTKKYCFDVVIRAVWKILSTVLIAAEVTDHTGRWD